MSSTAGARIAVCPQEMQALPTGIALEIKEAYFGGDHPDVAMTLNNVALLPASRSR